MKISYQLIPAVFVANNFGVETLTVPANKTTDPALKANYNYPLGHLGGLLVNHSTNTCWAMFLSVEIPVPTRANVVDFGVRFNGNGGQLTIPDRSNCNVYLATSAASNIEVRAMYYMRIKANVI